MKRSPYLLFTLYLLQCASGITDELRKKADATQLLCKEQAGLTEKEFHDWTNGIAWPTSDGGSCCEVCACWMREFGYMTNGRLNLTNMKKVNEQKWSEQVYIKEGNEIDETCTRQVQEAGRRECEIAIEFRACKDKLIDESPSSLASRVPGASAFDVKTS